MYFVNTYIVNVGLFDYLNKSIYYYGFGPDIPV
jgi:hypothetical protein